MGLEKGPHITLHTHKIPSHSSKKSRHLWSVMMDDIHQESRRKLVKTYQNVLTRKQTMVAEVCGETYLKNCEKKKKWKNSHRGNLTPQIKGESTEREREK